jgi:peptide/nickel transport system permease protein
VSASDSGASRRWRALRRILQAVFVVWGAATLAFILLRLAPGDPYATQLDTLPIPAEARAAWRAERGLDDPMATQYVRWIGNVARGKLGWSSRAQRPVADVLADVLPRTLALMGVALLTSMAGGMLIGAWQGTRAGSTGDQVVSTTTLLIYSLPEFWLAMLLLQLFAHGLGWLPATGIVSAEYEYLPFLAQLQDRLAHFVLPWLALSLLGIAVFARFQRSSMLDAWREPFVRTARAKGLAERGVRWHAWRTSLIPVLGVAGLVFPALVGGAVFVERVFAWPGMGYTTVMAVGARDYEFVTAAVVTGSAMTVMGSLLVDGLLRLADPRMRS